MLNLEPIAVQAAAEMIVRADMKSSENMINKALMVLAEQGVCAFALFLASRKRQQDQKAGEAIHQAMRHLLDQSGLGELASSLNVEEYKQLTQVGQGETELAALQRLLLTKQLMETALTYGRYQAKAQAA